MIVNSKTKNDTILSSEENHVLELMDNMEHEQLVYCNDKETGPEAIIAIHDTSLGPALGGTKNVALQQRKRGITDVLDFLEGRLIKLQLLA